MHPYAPVSDGGAYLAPPLRFLAVWRAVLEETSERIGPAAAQAAIWSVDHACLLHETSMR
jgi:hypothetical protein